MNIFSEKITRSASYLARVTVAFQSFCNNTKCFDNVGEPCNLSKMSSPHIWLSFLLALGISGASAGSRHHQLSYPACRASSGALTYFWPIKHILTSAHFLIHHCSSNGHYLNGHYFLLLWYRILPPLAGINAIFCICGPTQAPQLLLISLRTPITIVDVFIFFLLSHYCSSFIATTSQRAECSKLPICIKITSWLLVIVLQPHQAFGFRPNARVSTPFGLLPCIISSFYYSLIFSASTLLSSTIFSKRIHSVFLSLW